MQFQGLARGDARDGGSATGASVKTAIDSSVLLAIFNDEPEGRDWLKVLIAARREGPLVICEVVYAEIALAFGTEAELQTTLNKMGISPEPLTNAAAWRAGECFRAYRGSGGPREHMISDFLIAAHAEVQANRFAAIDRGYLRRCFPTLARLSPSNGRSL